MALKAVTLTEIERIFDVLDRLGLSREAVVIPLRPESPGRMRVLPNGKVEIVVESERPLDEWLPELEAWLRTRWAPERRLRLARPPVRIRLLAGGAITVAELRGQTPQEERTWQSNRKFRPISPRRCSSSS